MKASHSVSIMLLYCLLFSAFSCSTVRRAGGDKNQNIFLADPSILYYNGTYYLYGTGGTSTDSGFVVYTSPDMKNWKTSKEVNNGFALTKGDAYGTAGFWAPQVFVYNKKFYMAYVANENIAIAESESPLGPFKQKIKQQLKAPGKQIDPFVYIDENGKKYLYHVRLTNGNKIFVAEMTEDFSAIKPETLQECITATQPWENTNNASWPVTEGPSVMKRSNLYYLFYTANDFRNPDYAMGYAVSNHPNGPWKKYSGNPVLTKKVVGINGTGHGDFIITNNKKIFFVFHTHHSDTAVYPRKTAIIEAKFTKGQASGDRLNLKPKSYSMLKIKME